jgi:hypothetical protein
MIYYGFYGFRQCVIYYVCVGMAMVFCVLAICVIIYACVEACMTLCACVEACVIYSGFRHAWYILCIGVHDVVICMC